MFLNKGDLDGVRVLKTETVELMLQDHLQVNAKRLGLAESRQKYGLGGAVDGEGGYLWGGANGTQFWIDSKEQFYAIFMVQTQRYKAPTYNDFRRLASEAAGIDSTRGLGTAGQRAAGAGSPLGDLFKQRDTNGDGKLDRDEVPALLFNRLDADGDGFISEEEAKKLWRSQR
jgi:CubicO group peptidase (beta-lactamase class C family)